MVAHYFGNIINNIFQRYFIHLETCETVKKDCIGINILSMSTYSIFKIKHNSCDNFFIYATVLNFITENTLDSRLFIIAHLQN